MNVRKPDWVSFVDGIEIIGAFIFEGLIKIFRKGDLPRLSENPLVRVTLLVGAIITVVVFAHWVKADFSIWHLPFLLYQFYRLAVFVGSDVQTGTAAAELLPPEKLPHPIEELVEKEEDEEDLGKKWTRQRR